MPGIKLSKDQLYNFVKVKGSQVVTNMNHDPAKNANSVILKEGVGNTAHHPDGLVQGGYLYYLCRGVWTKTDYTSDPQPNGGGVCGGLSTGGSLAGISLGPYDEYTDPQKTGMLLQGVTTANIFSLGQLYIGDRVFVTAVNDLGTQFGIDISGTLTTKNRQFSSASPAHGNMLRPMGYVIDYNPDYIAHGFGFTQWEAVCLIQQSPVVSYYGYATGSALYQDFGI